MSQTTVSEFELESESESDWGTTSKAAGLLLEAVESTELEEQVILENDQLLDVREATGHLLLGYVSAPFPGKKEALLQLCDSWSDLNNVSFHLRPNGWIVFEFENEVESEMVLKGSPYFVMGRPVVMKSMPSCFEFDEQVLKYVAVWIKLPGLPFECWSASALSKITSKIGTPLCTDRPTFIRKNISEPRVLVEVDASEELVRSIQIKLPVGKSRVQSVVFEEEPEFCSVIGHASVGCTTTTTTTNAAAEMRSEEKIDLLPPPQC